MTYRDILNALNTDTWCNLTEEEKIDYFQYHFFPEGRHSEYDWSQRVPLFLKMFYKGE